MIVWVYMGNLWKYDKYGTSMGYMGNIINMRNPWINIYIYMGNIINMGLYGLYIFLDCHLSQSGKSMDFPNQRNAARCGVSLHHVLLSQFCTQDLHGVMIIHHPHGPHGI